MQKANKLDVIGSKTSVSFPKQGIYDVPAKIDTGADSSSVWATNIEEKDGILHYTLFDPTSPWYNGKEITTKEYYLRSIKNSFGEREFRYKVSLPVEINGKKIKARFTLSNRANNRYPILIGRKTLKNRFIVDVSRLDETSGHKSKKPAIKVLVLQSRSRDQISDFFDEAKKRYGKDIEFVLATYEELYFSIENNKLSISIAGKTDVAEFDLIYFMTRVEYADKAAIIANYAKFYQIQYFDKATALQPTDTKMHQLALLAMAQIHVPNTVHMAFNQWESNFAYLKRTLGLPFVFKDDNGRKGRNNFLIEDKKTFVSLLRSGELDGLNMIAQQYIPSEGYYRVVIFGTNVEFAMFRTVDQKVSHLYKRSRNGLPRHIKSSKVPTEAFKLAIQAADKLNIDVAGVDLLKDCQTHAWHVLEVNNSPQIGTGSFLDKKLEGLVKYIKEEIER